MLNGLGEEIMRKLQTMLDAGVSSEWIFSRDPKFKANVPAGERKNWFGCAMTICVRRDRLSLYRSSVSAWFLFTLATSSDFLEFGFA